MFAQTLTPMRYGDGFVPFGDQDFITAFRTRREFMVGLGAH